MMSNLEKWLNGFDLDEAGFEFGDPFQTKKYNQSLGTKWHVSIKLLIYADLFSQLKSGKLEAFGFISNENPDIGPKLIPAHIFAERPVFADCEENKVIVNNWIYERIKIVQAPAVYPQYVNVNDLTISTSAFQKSERYASAPDDVALFELDGTASIATHSPDNTTRRGGRFNTYILSKAVLAQISQDPALILLSAEKLHERFSKEFIQMFPPSEFQIATPSVRTLRSQLSRFRQEVAKTGENDLAS
jgi:hypothetical protein